VDAVKLHDDLAVGTAAILVMHHKNLPKFAGGLPTWQRDNVQSSVVAGDKGRLGSSYVCLRLQRTIKTLMTLFTKLKAYLSFKNGFTNDP